MPKLKIVNATWFKQSTLVAKMLSGNAKKLIQPQELEVLSVERHANEGYLRVKLPKAIATEDGSKTFQAWIVWDDDVLTQEELSQPRDIRLKVPYYNQVDSLKEPMRTCNTSSCAMAAKFLGAKITGDDAYYKVVTNFGDTTDHNAQTEALKCVEIKSTWRTNLDFVDLDKALEGGKPVVIGLLHRGSLSAPTGGHMVVVIGRNIGGYIVNDPFGSLMDAGGGYTGAVSNGEGAIYPRSVLKKRWLADGANSGWGRLFS